jgi:hypothetical protein
MRRRLVFHRIVCSVFCLAPAIVAAADLQEQTSRAFSRYAEEASQAFLQRTRAGGGSSNDGASVGLGLAPRDGEMVARPGRQDGIISVPGGLVHHWIGTTFIGGVTLTDVLMVSYAYDDYHAFYKPIVASRLLGHEGDTYRILLRIKESAGGMSAVLDVAAHVQYFYPNEGSAYSVSRSDEIRELKDSGSPSERTLPAGKDSGFLWRSVILTRFERRESGVLVEMETLGLSRSFPPMLRWFIEPIAQYLGRKSVRQSLQEFGDAVRARQRR